MNILTKLLLLNKLQLFIVLAIVFNIPLKAQLDNNWAFGIGCGVRFDSLNPTSYATLANTIVQSTALSTDNGRLIIYLAGSELRDSSNNVILGGDSINNFINSYKASFLLKFPSKIILFSQYIYDRINCPFEVCTNIAFTEVHDGPNGLFVYKKNTRLVTAPIDSRFAVIRHANGKDWWLLTHEIYNRNVASPTNSFYRFLITEDSIIGPEVQNIGYSHNRSNLWYGDAAVSILGDKVAFSLIELGMIELYDFNRCNGELSNLKTINSSTGVAKYSALEFSPSEQFLYATTGRGYDENALYQFDLNQANIGSSAVQLWSFLDIDTIRSGGLELGPDNKIYLTCYSPYTNMGLHNRLGIIHQPNQTGVLCNFVPFEMQLNNNCRTTLALPYIPNYNLSSLPVYVADAGRDTFFCASDSTIKAFRIGGDSIYGITYQWQAAPGIDTLTNREQLVLPPQQSRWYYVTLTDTNYVGPSCNSRLDSVYIEVRNCTGITETTTVEAKLYPNPTTGTLTIELPGGQGGSMALYNLLGQSVYQATLAGGQTTLTLNLPPGLYLYRIGSGGKAVNGKLLVE